MTAALAEGFVVRFQDYVPDHAHPMASGWLDADGGRVAASGVARGPALDLDTALRLVEGAERFTIVNGELVAQDVPAGRDDASFIQQTRVICPVGLVGLPPNLIA